MRAFIAIELPKEIKEALAGLEEQLKKTNADVKWVIPENLHLTLKFLGDIEDKQLKKVSEILDSVTNNYPPYTIKISSIGAFPKLSLLKVVWVGIVMGADETKKIFKELEDRIEKLGIPKDGRAFSSHITLGRTRSPSNRKELAKEIQRILKNFKLDNSEFQVTKITLFKSTLSSIGPTYEALKAANLKTS
ncbi:MAG: RNA 2',3'-cyclic phosphodiesterase [Candidatus Omnitrophota bacterium]